MSSNKPDNTEADYIRLGVTPNQNNIFEQELNKNIIIHFTENSIPSLRSGQLIGKSKNALLKAHQSSLEEAVRLARKEELLTVDDEVRLHNTVGESYQEWFTKRLATLTKDQGEKS